MDNETANISKGIACDQSQATAADTLGKLTSILQGQLLHQGSDLVVKVHALHTRLDAGGHPGWHREQGKPKTKEVRFELRPAKYLSQLMCRVLLLVCEPTAGEFGRAWRSWRPEQVPSLGSEAMPPSAKQLLTTGASKERLKHTTRCGIRLDVLETEGLLGLKERRVHEEALLGGWIDN